MSELLKVGVFGVGALGRHHARLYHENPKADVVGIFDVNRESAEKVGAEFGLKVFDDWKSLAEACDAMSVAVPANFHASATIPLLEMGKHVLSEKPLAATVEEGEAIFKAAEKNNVVLGVGHVERFNSAMDYLMANRTSPRYIEANRLAKYPPSRPGLPPRGTEVSVILDLMVHDIDLVLALVDAEVEKIDVLGSAVLSPGEDIVKARIKFVNGSCADITSSRLSLEPVRQVKVYQDEMCLDMDFGNVCGKRLARTGNEITSQDITLEAKNALAAELDDFIDAVNKTRATGKIHETRVSGAAGLKALKLAAAIEEEVRRYNKQYGF